LSIYFFNHPEKFGSKKKLGMAGVVWVGFSRNKKDQEKHRIVVEDYNNGNNFFVCFFNIDYLHKKDK